MKLFGPLLPIELVRIARRQRLPMIRCAYAVGIVAFVATVYAIATDNWTVRIKPQQLAPITEGLFYGLLGLQFLVAAVVTTNWMADAIAREKERQTLPFLLATPLTDREIILGKLVARLAQVVMLLLAGLPVLCALQFFGGIEPLAVLLGYAATAVTVLSLGSLSMLCSIYSRTTRAAQQRTARIIGMYIVPTVVIGPILRLRPHSVVVQDVYDWINAGNPIAVVQRLAEGIIGGGRFDSVIWPVARDYMVFHLLAAGVFLTWAARKLRSVAAVHADGPPPRKQTGLFRPPPRTPVGDRPVLWKALFFDFRQVRTVGGRALVRVLYILSFMPVIVLLVFTGVNRSWHTLPAAMNGMIGRGLGTIVLCGLLVMIAANSSGCFAVERRKRTIEELFLTDLSAEEILGQKWWASIFVVRWALVWVGVHWLIAVLTGGLHPLAVPVLVLEWAAFAAFTASLGIYCATRWPKARTAGVRTGLIGFLATTMPLLVAGAGALITERMNSDSGWFILPASVSPPVALGVSGFYGTELGDLRRKYPTELILAIVGAATGVGLSVVASVVLWRRACRRFRRTIE